MCKSIRRKRVLDAFFSLLYKTLMQKFPGNHVMIAKIVRTSGKCWLRRWSCVFVKLSKGLHVEWISRLSAAYVVCSLCS